MKEFLRYTLLGLLAQGSHGFLAPRSEQQAKYRIPSNKTSIIPHSYIVRLHDNHTIEDHYVNIGVSISDVASEFNYLAPLNLYYFQLEAQNSTLIHELIRRDPGIKRVGHDYYGETEIDPIHHNPDGYDHGGSSSKQPVDTPAVSKRWDEMFFNAQWHLAMIGLIPWLEDAGKGVNIYIFDSGIRLGLSAFGSQEGKMWNLNSLKEEDKAPYCDNETMRDTEGHGTKVAVVAAGYNNGMLSPAWRANLVSVKVKSVSDVISEHKKYWGSPPDGWRGSVINVSMGFPKHATDPDFQYAWDAARAAGIPIAAAAGNTGENWLHAPARFKSTYSVGAVDARYRRWEQSHYHRKLNVFAPGVRVPTADHITGRPITGDGTSLASPLVAGVMAMMVGYEGAWNIPDGKNIYARLDANLVPLVTMDENMTKAGVEPNLINTGFFNPDREFDRHPYAGIPWTEPPEIGPGSFLDKRQRSPYDKQRGDYWDKNYYDGPQHTVEFAGAQPTIDSPLSEEDLDKGYFDTSIHDECI
ncbi:hypothetical protein FPRO06_11856 [Fusarium proliferatum]|nr:hypothetical protein FPRO06_11856 [Fusarium proliferatum]